MPSIALTVSPQGLIIKAGVNHSTPRQQAISAAGGQVPAWQFVDLLVDTGASVTVIDPKVSAALGLVSHSLTPMLTPSTGAVPVQCATYDVALFIPPIGNAVGHYVPALAVVEADFSAQPIDGLLGRDVLANCVLTYIGQSDIFVLSY